MSRREKIRYASTTSKSTEAVFILDSRALLAKVADGLLGKIN
jgi:hypothetical protein